MTPYRFNCLSPLSAVFGFACSCDTRTARARCSRVVSGLRFAFAVAKSKYYLRSSCVELRIKYPTFLNTCDTKEK